MGDTAVVCNSLNWHEVRYKKLVGYKTTNTEYLKGKFVPFYLNKICTPLSNQLKFIVWILKFQGTNAKIE